VNLKLIVYLLLMDKYNHIKALFFLGIFSIILLHQAVPHLHHQHEVGHSHSAVVHGDSHSHDHRHEVPEKENPSKGFLDLFLEMHVHSISANEILLIHESSIKQLDVKKNISKVVSVVHSNSSIDYGEPEKIKIYRPPNTYFNPYLLSLDLRGPPTLG